MEPSRLRYKIRGECAGSQAVLPTPDTGRGAQANCSQNPWSDCSLTAVSIPVLDCGHDGSRRLRSVDCGPDYGQTTVLTAVIGHGIPVLESSP